MARVDGAPLSRPPEDSPLLNLQRPRTPAMGALFGVRTAHVVAIIDFPILDGPLAWERHNERWKTSAGANLEAWIGAAQTGRALASSTRGSYLPPGYRGPVGPTYSKLPTIMHRPFARQEMSDG